MSAFTRCRLGAQVRLVRMCEWLNLIPTWIPLSQMTHFLAIKNTSFTPPHYFTKNGPGPQEAALTSPPGSPRPEPSLPAKDGMKETLDFREMHAVEHLFRLAPSDIMYS